MEHPFLRNEMLWGPEAQARLARAHVLLLICRYFHALLKQLRL